MSSPVTNEYPSAHLSDYPEHTKWIMAILAGWNKFEDDLLILFGFVTNMPLPQADLIFAASTSSFAKIEMTRVAAKFSFKDNAARINELNAICDSSAKRLRIRNLYAHALYVVNEKKELCIRRRQFELVEPQAILVLHLSALEEEMRSLLKCAFRLGKFLDALGVFPRALPPT